MEKEIIIKLDDLYEKRYKLRKSGKDGISIEVTVPRIILEYEARKHDLSVGETLERFEGVWKFNNLKGVYLFIFEEREKSSSPMKRQLEENQLKKRLNGTERK